MTAKILLSCDDCGETVTTGFFKREFESVTGRSWGFGTWKVTSIDDLVKPTGWQWMEEATGCTYCPKCWREVIAHTEFCRNEEKNRQARIDAVMNPQAEKG